MKYSKPVDAAPIKPGEHAFAAVVPIGDETGSAPVYPTAFPSTKIGFIELL
jgi:hypothetical protein